MTDVTERNNQLIEGYLDAVRRATAALAPSRREDLLTDLREHIAVVRADLNPETEAGVRIILDRLGDPQSIAHEAMAGEPSSTAPGGGGSRRARVAITIVITLIVLVCLAAVYLGMARGITGDHPVPTEPRPRPSSLG